jgi:hypothetical protein
MRAKLDKETETCHAIRWQMGRSIGLGHIQRRVMIVYENGKRKLNISPLMQFELCSLTEIDVEKSEEWFDSDHDDK